MSRTSARQQRMREQTLNEECIVQDELGPRTTSECRSKGSKLIISSPTTTSHPCLNLLLSGSQAQTQHIEDNVKLTNQYNRGFRASALLASLNATDQQHQPTETHPKRVFQPIGASQHMISHLPEINTPQRDLSFTGNISSTICANAVITTQDFIDSSRHSTCALSTSNNRTPNQSSLPIQFTHRNLPHCQANYTIHVKHGSFDGTSPNTQVKSNSELSVLEIESNGSPTPSDVNSPVESCFANIMEDQGSDSFDLNNITPSINLSSSVGVSDPTVDFPHQTPDSSERLQHDSSSSITTKATKTLPIMSNKLDSLVHISPVDVNPFFLGENTKSNRDETGITVSSSCPATVPDDSCVTDNTSPLQPGSRAPQSVLSESGSSPLGGLNSAPEATSLPVSHGSLSIGSISSPIGNRNVDDQRVAWMRDRSKKDSHNRIERKRRDYINCQIAELGSLLPEDMFRDGDGKKNKGNILKNSVEFICLLRSELAQIPEVRRETSLAAKVIGQLVKRIQELESVINVTPIQQTPHANRNNPDYQNLLQEWIMLHENNLQNSIPISTTDSPITRCSFPQSTTADGSSPGLSSVGTDEMISSDTKIIFSNSLASPIVGSAPVRSNPLSSSRINSPVPNTNFSTRPAGGTVLESPLRFMRERCTSLTVSTTSVSNSSNDANMPNVRLHGPEYQQQAANKIRAQRILQSHNSSQLRILQPGNQSTVVSHAQLFGLPFQSKPIPQSSHLPSPSSSLSPQHHLSVNQHHQLHPSNRSGMTFGSIPNQQFVNPRSISASLPVNVNPLLCGIQDPDMNDLNDEKISQLYTYDSSNSFIPQLKSEPICESDSNYNTMHSLGLDLCHGNTGNTILEPVTHFDPLIASVVQSSNQHYQQQQQQRYQEQHHYHLRHYLQSQQQQPHQQHRPSFNHSGGTSLKTLDLSTPPMGLDIDEFQFDDVPME
ncbi:Microphthalmia-associated transcription factor [Schistosoma japonicum]|uniref:Microphthalmia-associated transcription factor n=1 Tax=Schistosoma japonicum TaxID=6182 RepID=A0A4Z2DNE6_SCHJA|nr:Microphthalmia-associated transcription factor [Schistosoma japonicum]